GVHARLLVSEVLVVADQHPDRGIEDLAADAVTGLVGSTGLRVPARAVQLVERLAERLQLVRRDAGRGQRADGDRLVHAGDDVQVALGVVVHDVGRVVPEGGGDEAGVAVWRLGDVRV